MWLIPVGGSVITHLVEWAVRPPALGLYHHIGMQEVGCNHVRHKGCVLVLEDYSDNVVPDVPLSLQLSTGPQAFTTWLERGSPGAGRGRCPQDGGRVWGRQRARLRIRFHPPKISGETCLKIILVFLESCDR